VVVRELLGVLTGRIEVATKEDGLCPEALNRGHLAGFASSGTQIVARTPNRCAAYAIDWPWLPVEAVTTPRSRSPALSWESKLIPPLTLNAPIGW
jgi:hypothetical protein